MLNNKGHWTRRAIEHERETFEEQLDPERYLLNAPTQAEWDAATPVPWDRDRGNEDAPLLYDFAPAPL